MLRLRYVKHLRLTAIRLLEVIVLMNEGDLKHGPFSYHINKSSILTVFAVIVSDISQNRKSTILSNHDRKDRLHHSDYGRPMSKKLSEKLSKETRPDPAGNGRPFWSKH